MDSKNEEVKTAEKLNEKKSAPKQNEVGTGNVQKDDTKPFKLDSSTMINPLLRNGITNRDIFRTLLFNFSSANNAIPISKAKEFIIDLLRRPIHDEKDIESENRLNKNIDDILISYSKDKRTLNED